MKASDEALVSKTVPASRGHPSLPWCTRLPSPTARGSSLGRPEKGCLPSEGQLGVFLATPCCLPDSPPFSQGLLLVSGRCGHTALCLEGSQLTLPQDGQLALLDSKSQPVFPLPGWANSLRGLRRTRPCPLSSQPASPSAHRDPPG